MSRRPLAEALDRGQLRGDLLVGQLGQPLELERAVLDVLGEVAQVGDLRRARGPARADLVGVGLQQLLAAWARGRRTARSRARRSSRAALVESCCPTIERSSAP